MDHFADNMLVGYGDADVVLVQQYGESQGHLGDHPGHALDADGVTHDKRPGQNDVETGAVVGQQSLQCEAGTQ